MPQILILTNTFKLKSFKYTNLITHKRRTFKFVSFLSLKIFSIKSNHTSLWIYINIITIMYRVLMCPEPIFLIISVTQFFLYYEIGIKFHKIRIFLKRIYYNLHSYMLSTSGDIADSCLVTKKLTAGVLKFEQVSYVQYTYEY